MKTISFSQTQKEILLQHLKQNLDYWTEVFKDLNNSLKKRKEKSHIDPIVSVIEKITKHNNFSLTNNEKIACIICANEHYEEVKKQLNLPNFMSWLTINEKQLYIIEELDDCKDILLKCGYFNKKEYLYEHNKTFRYKNILNAIQRLRLSERIFLSNAGEGNHYKIAFICDNNEYAIFELKWPISWREIEFSKLGEDKPENYVPKRFSQLTTKQKAKEILQKCDKKNYPDGVLDIMVNLLS